MRPTSTPVMAKEVIVYFSHGYEHISKIAKGIMEYTSQCPSFKPVCIWNPQHERIFDRLHQNVAGIITVAPDYQTLKRTVETGIPTICISSRFHQSLTHEVVPDNFEIGRIAARFYLKNHYENFLFIGYKGFRFSEDRFNGFKSEISIAGKKVAFLSSENYYCEQVEKEMRKMLVSISKPCACFVANDILGQTLISSILEAGFCCPGEFSVLGVDDDVFIRGSCAINLSSIPINSKRIGRETAMLMEKLISHPDDKKIYQLNIPPEEPVLRISSDYQNSLLPLVIKKSQAYIQSHYSESITLADLAKAAGSSKRTLQKYYSDFMGHSPNDEIRNVRLQRAKLLLTTEDKNLEAIAQDVGFGSAALLCRHFRKAYGITPSNMRKNYLKSFKSG